MRSSSSPKPPSLSNSSTPTYRQLSSVLYTPPLTMNPLTFRHDIFRFCPLAHLHTVHALSPHRSSVFN